MEAGCTAWRSEVSGIIHDTGNRCDEACFYERFFRAAIEKRKLDYQQAESTLSQAASRATKSIESSVAGAARSISEFLKKESAVVAFRGHNPVIFALIVGGGIVLCLLVLFGVRGAKQ